MADDDKADPPADDVEDTEDEEFEAPDQETWTKTTEALNKANNEAKKWRLRAQGKDEKWTVPGHVKEAPADDDDDDEGKKPPTKRRQPRINEDQVRREAEEATLARAKPGLVSSAARDALRAAGLILPDKGADAAYKRAIRLLDMDEIEVDEDFTVSGVEDQVKQVKRDYPELFAKRGARTVNAGAGSDKDGAGEAKESSSNKLAALILGS
jgi:hypothetical protein